MKMQLDAMLMQRLCLRVVSRNDTKISSGFSSNAYEDGCLTSLSNSKVVISRLEYFNLECSGMNYISALLGNFFLCSDIVTLKLKKKTKYKNIYFCRKRSFEIYRKIELLRHKKTTSQTSQKTYTMLR